MSVEAGATAQGVAGQMAADRTTTSLRRGAFAAFLMLVVQYGLGIYVNLYVDVPSADAGKGFGQAIGNGPAGISLHIVLGLLLILSALGVLVQASLARRPVLIALAVVGLISILGAAMAGSSFVGNGHDSESMVMAELTGVALLCYGTSLFMLGSPRAKAP